ncbi:bifunctional 4-hydroxy-2-oxoglutarate aldolase/2-dehydro-3-deoxy-phosphogluconate aldolase [Muricauda sp. 2012CJ35-5]|uniref:2-dehydro-3-deoxy-phosphogluconate aldolase n=1 Tax=Flagellimonas spongiicola TaxID=2942208 RepID=A0ABT0PTY7_9FLAO|nr:bifunctional 4-hydroxy-2-oxoglutarate aldolase/2-dehydro-3-deoxy-phosphogluconate aldolase [Allomuricauda spongiicola]MCL6274671.1 bifunctional 4-hydroxy-2-oxoglutarate aldolase/2-dehydro-3-deoxy-phosphogluconate aldolase [Allomuricauda spongiicola]
MTPEIIRKVDSTGVIAVLVVDELKHAVPLAEALLKGGIDTIELTLRTPIALDAGKQMKSAFPELTLGYGTVLTVEQVTNVLDSGADFAVAPGCNPSIIRMAQKKGLSYAPGIMTPTDIEMAVQEGCRVLKFFPAESSGGLKHLKSMAAPYQHLGLKFIPLGGVNMDNAKAYLESPLISAVGGSWVAKREMIVNEEWDKITANAKEIKSLINGIES